MSSYHIFKASYFLWKQILQSLLDSTLKVEKSWNNFSETQSVYIKCILPAPISLKYYSQNIQPNNRHVLGTLYITCIILPLHAAFHYLKQNSYMCHLLTASFSSVLLSPFPCSSCIIRSNNYTCIYSYSSFASTLSRFDVWMLYMYLQWLSPFAS